MKQLLYPFILLLLFFTACQSEGTTGNKVKAEASSSAKEELPASNVEAAPLDYKVLAEAYCNCAAPTIAINKQLEKLMNEKKDKAFEALLPDAERAFKEAMRCCRKAKFGQSPRKVNKKKLLKPLKKKCPDLPKQLILKMVMEIE